MAEEFAQIGQAGAEDFSQHVTAVIPVEVDRPAPSFEQPLNRLDRQPTTFLAASEQGQVIIQMVALDRLGDGFGAGVARKNSIQRFYQCGQGG